MIFEWLLIIIFIVYFSTFAITKHRAYQTHGFDLGNYDQSLWNTIHGRLLVSTNWPLFGESRLAYHVEPILFLVAPLYWIHPGPETLLIIQAVIIGLGAWPIAKFARRRLKNPWMGPLFAGCYLLFPALESGTVFEFHAVALAPTFLAMAFYCIEKRSFKPFIFWGILAISCKEEMSLLVAMMGIYIIFKQKRHLLGLIVILFSLIWFWICMQVILPYFNVQGESAHLGRYAYLGDRLTLMIVNVVKKPELLWENIRDPMKLAYLWRIPFPTGYLAILSPEVLFLALPTVLINVLSLFPAMYMLDLVHYSIPIVPFVVMASIIGFERLLQLIHRFFVHIDRRFLFLVFSGYLIFTSLFYHRVFGHTPLTQTFSWPVITEHHRIVDELLKEIPNNAVVSAQMSLNPHITQRPVAYVFPEYSQADYIVLDVTAVRDNMFELNLEKPISDEIGGSFSGDPSLTQTEYQRLVVDLLNNPQYGIVHGRDGFLMVKKGAPNIDVPDTFFTAFLTDEQNSVFSVQANFGNDLELVDLMFIPVSGSTYYLQTFWQGKPRSDDNWHIYLTLLDRSIVPSHIVASQELTVSVFGPKKLWNSGIQIKDTAFVQFPSNPDYALGLMVGTDMALVDPEKRFHVKIETGIDDIGYVDPYSQVLVLGLK